MMTLISWRYLTADILRSVLHYDADSGLFTRLTGRYKGKIAGSVGGAGYIQITVCGIKENGHRLAWLYMTGEWPTHGLDHRNLIKTDNRWENLRPATKQQNNYNRGLTVKNKSGYKGVSRCGNRWRAQCRVNGINYSIGYFLDPASASSAYQDFARMHHGEFFRA